MKKQYHYIIFAFAALIFSLPLSSSSQVPSFGSPIVDAADKGNLDQVERLIKDGAFVDETGDFKVTALMRAAYRGNTEIAEMLIKAGADINAQDIGGASPMHMAARSGKAEIIKLLMKHKADVDIKDEEGWTPLMRASNSSKPEAVETLLQSGANPNQKNAWDESSLIYAVKRGNVKVASSLMVAGAKPEGKDADGRSITQLAELSKNSEIKQLLESPSQVTELPTTAPVAVQSKPEAIADSKLPEQLASPPAPSSMEAKQSPKPQASITETPKADVAVAPTSASATMERKQDKPFWKKMFRDKDEPAPVEVISNTAEKQSAPELKREEPKKVEIRESSLSPSAPPPAKATPLPMQEPAASKKEDIKTEPAKDEKAQTKPLEKNFLIQIGFFQETDKEKAGAKMHEIWDEKAKTHSDVFKNLTAVVTGVKLHGQGDLYRVRAGYFENRDDAAKACGEIGDGCVVIRASAAEQERSLEAEKELLAGKEEKKPEPETTKKDEPKPEPKVESKAKIENALVEKLQRTPSTAITPPPTPVTTSTVAATPAPAKPEKSATKKLPKNKRPKDEVAATKELNAKQLEGTPVTVAPPTQVVAKKEEVRPTSPIEKAETITSAAKPEPIKEETAKVEPTQPKSVAVTSKPEILAKAPTQSPVKSEPTKAEPMKPEPVEVQAIIVEPTQPKPVVSSAKPEILAKAEVQSPAKPEPVKPEAVKPGLEAKKAGAAKPEPVKKKARMKPEKEIEETKELNNKQIPETTSVQAPAALIAEAKPVEETKSEPKKKLTKEEKKTKALNDRQLGGEAVSTPAVAPATAKSKPATVTGKAKPKGNEVEATKELNSKQLEAPSATAEPPQTPLPIKKIEPQAPVAESTVKLLDAAPIKPAEEGEVEVKEAIRVPLSEMGAKKPEYFIAAEKPAYSYGDIIVEIFWFGSEAAANAFADDFKANRPELITGKNMSPKPHESAKFILSAGPFGTVGESQEVCRIAKSAGLYCSTQKVLQGMSGNNNSRLPAGAELRGKFWALLGGYQSAREAGNAFAELEPKIPAEFKSVGHDVKASRSSRGKTFRLRAGEFSSRPDADRFCATIENFADLCQVIEE